MKKFLTFKKILLAILIFIGVSQFIKIDKENETVNSSLDFLSIESPTKGISKMIKNQCYDCHSDETKYPWYADIAPVSWWLKSNINGARDFMNFSTWGLLTPKQKIAKMQECFEALQEEEMPVALYILMHDQSQFSEKETESLQEWFKNYNAKLN